MEASNLEAAVSWTFLSQGPDGLPHKGNTTFCDAEGADFNGSFEVERKHQRYHYHHLSPTSFHASNAKGF